MSRSQDPAPQDGDEGADLRVAFRAWGRAYRLTKAEISVLRLIVGGHLRRSLAALLGVSENTVKKHIQNLLQKTGDRTIEAAGLRLLREAREGSHPGRGQADQPRE